MTALATLRRLLGEAPPCHPWDCHCMACTDWALTRERTERALPALLDLVEAADRIYARLFHDIALMEPDEQAELMNYEDKREALERVVGK